MNGTEAVYHKVLVWPSVFSRKSVYIKMLVVICLVSPFLVIRKLDSFVTIIDDLDFVLGERCEQLM